MGADGPSSGFSPQRATEGRVIELYDPTRASDLAEPVAESPVTANKMLSAMKGVIKKKCWRLCLPGKSVSSNCTKPLL